MHFYIGKGMDKKSSSNLKAVYDYAVKLALDENDDEPLVTIESDSK